ncbi:MAG: alpha/beta hydrolase [Nodosilinea sp.]|jgi:hypothetical protein
MKQLILVGLTLLSSLGLKLAPARAATEIMLKYQGFSRNIPIADLVSLTTTGEASPSLAALLAQAGQKPEDLRSLLIHPVSVDPVLLDRALNSWPGEWILDQLATALHPVTAVASRQALRSSLVLAATPDGQLNLIEVLQTYPTDELVLEGDRIESAYNQLGTFLRSLNHLWPLKSGKLKPSPPTPQSPRKLGAPSAF